MLKYLLFALLCGTQLWAQAKPANPPAGAKTQPTAEDDEDKQPRTSTAAVPEDAPVLTINGYCAHPAANSPSAKCQTIVTRAQFERMVNALEPAADPKTRRHLATAYPQFLVMSEEAEKRGIEKTAAFAERMEFARLQILSQELVRQIQDEAARVSSSEIADYYQKHSADFEQARIERLVIPNRQEGAGKGKDSEAAMTKEAETLRARAAAGEDFTKLQKEAYGFAGVGGNTEPNPSMGKLRRRGLPLGHVSVFALKPGEVSPLISDATGHYVYKIVAKDLQPQDAVTPEITSVLRRQRMQLMIKDIQQRVTTEVNQSYFKEAKDDDND